MMKTIENLFDELVSIFMNSSYFSIKQMKLILQWSVIVLICIAISGNAWCYIHWYYTDESTWLNVIISNIFMLLLYYYIEQLYNALIRYSNKWKK